MSAPSPAVLWYQARGEHPADPDGARQRYLELMREHGHIVKREPGDESPGSRGVTTGPTEGRS